MPLPGIGSVYRLVHAVSRGTDMAPQRHGRHVALKDGHGLIEVRGLADGDGDRTALADTVQKALRTVRGVRWSQVNAVTGHALIAFEQGSVDVGELLEAVESAEEEHGTADAGWSRDTPPHPADPTALRAAVAALAADCAGLGAAAVTALLRVPAPPALRALVGVVEAQPRVRRLAEQVLGQAGTDLAVGIGSGILNGLTEGVGPLIVTTLSHAQLVAEVRSRQAVWRRREAALCAAPGCLPDQPPVKSDRSVPFPDGPVEAFADRVAAVSGLGAAVVLAVTGDVNRAAGILLIGVPPAARLGREAFAATLARGLAGRQVLPMDPGAFRRLDRVTVVVVERAAVDDGEGLRVLPLGSDGRDDAAEAGETAAETVRRLQSEGHGVLLVAAGDNDALVAADVAVGVHRDGATVGWAADLLCGPEPVRAVIAAVPVARRVSRRSVTLAGLGSALAAVLTALTPWPYSDLTMQPVYVTGVLTQLDGVLAARQVLRDVPATG